MLNYVIQDCLHPQLVKKPGQCCEEWVCSGDRFNNTTSLGADRLIFSSQGKTPYRRQIVRYTPWTNEAGENCFLFYDKSQRFNHQ